MQLKTRPSAAFQEDMQIQKEREEILEKGIQEFQSSRTAQEEENHISKFLKLPRAPRIALKEGRAKPWLTIANPRC